VSENCPTCRTFAQENNALHQEIAGLNAEVLKQVRQKAALQGQLTKQRKAEDISRHVTAVLRVWRARCSPRASISPSGKNADHVRTALLHFTDPDLTMTQRRRLLYDCVHGAALRPYDDGYGRRTANPAGSRGQGATRRVTTAHIFASEERIESLAGYYRMVQSKPEKWKWRAYAAARDLQELWFYLAMQEDVGRPEASPLYVEPPAVDPETTAHLFLDDRSQQPAAIPEPARPTLFVIEGEAA
jgi:hypothetical protein